MKTEHITAIWQSVLYAARRRPAGDIPAGQHTHSAQVNAPIVGIPILPVFPMGPVLNAVTHVRTVARKNYIPTKMSVQDIISTVM